MAKRKDKAKRRYREIKTTESRWLLEAVNRMKFWNLDPIIIQHFLKKGIISFSSEIEPENFYRKYDCREWERKVEELEKKHNIHVYHVVHYILDDMEILDCLYVHDYMRHWESEWEFLKEGIENIYAINLTVEEFSEFGSGRYAGTNGALGKLQ